MLMNYQAQVLSISHDRMKPLIFFYFRPAPLAHGWGRSKQIFLPTPADLSRKDIWFLRLLPDRNRVRSLLVWLQRKNKLNFKSCHLR